MGFRRLQITFLVLVGLVSSTLVFYGCSSSNSGTTSGTSQYIYATSGNAYAGAAVVMSTPSNLVVQFNLDGSLNQVLQDYTLSPGDTPVALVDYDSSSILVLVENAASITNRRIDRVFKNGTGAETFLTNSATLGVAAVILNDLAIGSDGGFLIARGQATPNGQIEKFTSSKTLIQFAAINYVNNPQSTCITSTNRFTKIVNGPAGQIIAAHAFAAQNHIDVINPNGYQVAADCYSTLATPGATYFPTAMLYHAPTGYLFVAYGNNAGPIHQIYAYQFNGNTLSLVTATPVFNNLNVLQGPSAMGVMSDGSILISSAASTFNTIEKFTWNSSSLSLTRATTSPMVPPSVYTRSISGLISPAD